MCFESNTKHALSLRMIYISIYLNLLLDTIVGTVVQPVSINIVFGGKQAQQYSRTHQLGFIWAVSRTLQFSSIFLVWVTARFCFVQVAKCYKDDTYFSGTFPFFEKATNIFNATGHHCMQPHPYQNLHWYCLISRKNIWPKISVTYFTKWFQSIFTVGGWKTYPFNLPLLAPAYVPTQSCKRASFWSLNLAWGRNHKPKAGSSQI